MPASDLASVTTASLADACLRMDVQLRVAPVGLRPVIDGTSAAGRVLPVRHAGSVDVFFEAYERAEEDDVLVIDNGGRTDEACIGDLTVIEAREAGLAGIVLWGFHRDSDEVMDLGLPVFTYGSLPAGPVSARSRPDHALDFAEFGPFRVTSEDAVLADTDGAVFVPLARVDELVAGARAIIDKERAQAEEAKAGKSLRQQMQFRNYLTRREADPSYTFRQHLRETGGEIEE